ncbi:MULTISPECIES: hypothetical protein [unclassified Methylobacterium]|uniref:hypothetical protein n=1 Tax=unclassified Methylobacterium TaxID=2615210 RepID=UPI001FB99227|nr:MULTISPECIES: hypothetical protein [unclassified Methylobacterium]MCJ2015946.1 hypothetical protein [Methylobacterium sp. E-065]
MTPRAMDRLARLEANAARPTTGKHLIFRIEARSGTPTDEIVTFLKDRGHSIHEGDDVFVMNVSAYGMAEGEPPRDLSPTLLTEEARAMASAAGQWPKGCERFTFRLDSPRDLQ